MLSKKERQVLVALVEQAGHYVTSKELAQKLALSDKTVRKYVNTLATVVQREGANIDKTQGYGYRLTIQDTPSFQKFYDKLQHSYLAVDVTQLTEASDRQRYVFTQLFFSKEKMSVNRLEQELYISRTSVVNLLAEIKKQLSHYGLSLDNTEGLRIVGDEQYKRQFIKDYFFEMSYEQSLSAYIENVFLPEGVSGERLMLFVIDACRAANLKLTDYVLHNLVLHLSLAIQRLRQGYVLESFPISSDIETALEYQVALNIIERIKEELQIVFPEGEANYIALHLKVKTTPSNISLQERHNEVQMLQELQDALAKLEKQFGIPMVQDEVLIDGLSAHFIPFLVRLRNKIKLDNPLIHDIQAKYAMELNLVQQAFQSMPLIQSYQVSIDEWAYILLHVLASIERHSHQRKKKALVICATGYGSAQMLKNRLENEFGNQLDIVDVIGYYEITEELLQSADIILSSISLSNIILPIPVMHVSVFLTDEDITLIRRWLGGQVERQYKAEMKPEAHTEEDAQAIFRRVFADHRYLLIEEPIEKGALIERMVQTLDSEDKADFCNQMIRQIDLREAVGSVVFGEQFALPHPAIPLSTHAQIVVSLCPQGVIWSDEHDNIQIVCLMSPSKSHNNDMKYISRALVKLIQSPELHQTILRNPTLSQFEQCFVPLISQEIQL